MVVNGNRHVTEYINPLGVPILCVLYANDFFE